MPLVGAIVPAMVGAAVSTGIGAGITAATEANEPDSPDYSRASKAVVDASLATLPGQRMVEAAARMGLKVQYPTGRYTDLYGDQKTLLGPNGQEAEYTAGQSIPPGWTVVTKKVYLGSEPEMATADFTGIGDLDNQRLFAQQMAQAQLELSQKYAPDFIAQARAMEQEADPAGWAARQLLHQQIQRLGFATDNAPRPVADEMERQLLQEQGLGNRLTSDTRRQLAATMAARAGLGDAPQADLAAAIESLPGQARQYARQQKELSWLTSGATPQDVAYRREQQQMANMGAFIAGQTPTAQFRQLSGAQQGSAPMLTSSPLPALAGSATINAGTNAALANYQQQVTNATQPANPWLAGLGTILQIGRTVAAENLKSR